MKKLLTIALALILAVFMTMSICAANNGLNPTDPENNTSTGTVTVDLNKANAGTVYSVDVEWNSLVFTYNFGTGDRWDPETHEYNADQQNAGSWANNGTATVVVKNHSNAAVDVAAKFGDAATITTNNVTATLTNNTFTLPTAEGTAPGTAPNGTITCTVSGIPAASEGFPVGTITVTITAVNQNP